MTVKSKSMHKSCFWFWLEAALEGPTLCSRRARFCCCSMRSDAEAGGEAALILRTTRMLSSGRGGSPKCSRFSTLMVWSCSKPPRVNWTRESGFYYFFSTTDQNKQQGAPVWLTSMLFHSSNNTFFIGKCGAWPLQNFVTMPKSMTEMGSLLNSGAPTRNSLSRKCFQQILLHNIECFWLIFTQLWSEGFPYNSPLRLVRWVVLLDCFHH